MVSSIIYYQDRYSICSSIPNTGQDLSHVLFEKGGIHCAVIVTILQPTTIRPNLFLLRIFK